jgi:hypothetical protein
LNTSRAKLREFVVDFVRVLGVGADTEGNERNGAPGTGDASTDGKGA